TTAYGVALSCSCMHFRSCTCTGSCSASSDQSVLAASFVTCGGSHPRASLRSCLMVERCCSAYRRCTTVLLTLLNETLRSRRRSRTHGSWCQARRHWPCVNIDGLRRPPVSVFSSVTASRRHS